MQPPPFDALPNPVWEALCARAWEVRLAPDQPVSNRGESRDSILLVKQGLLRASVVSSEGKRFTFRLLGPGDTSGEASLVGQLPAVTDIIAMKASLVSHLPRRECAALLQAHPDFASAVLRLLSARLHEMAGGMERLALVALRGRLATVLLRLDTSSGRRPITMPQSELSAMVAATREAVNRQLGSWEAQGVLERKAEGIEILRPAVLRRVAGARE